MLTVSRLPASPGCWTRPLTIGTVCLGLLALLQQGQSVIKLYPVHHLDGEVCCMIAGTPTNDAPKFNPGFMNALPDISAAPIASKDAAAENDGKVL